MCMCVCICVRACVRVCVCVRKTNNGLAFFYITFYAKCDKQWTLFGLLIEHKSGIMYELLPVTLISLCSSETCVHSL
jgi:hypothetical protein